MKNSLYFLPTVSILFFGVITINCQIINIPADYNTIQEGINVAQNGDTVLVDEGTYFENINYRGKNIVVASRYIIDGDYDHILNTLIDGSQSTEVDTGSCVIFGSGEDSTAVIQGFTLTGGTGTSFDFGGGNLFREGGAIIMSNSSATIKNNLIYNNEAAVVSGVGGGGGGGISSMFGNPRILNNVIMMNTATYAAGMVLNWSAGIIRNNIISANEGGGQFGTGGLMVWESDPWTAIIENNTIVGNISTTTAGGLSVQNTSAIIRNNIIWGNTQQTGTQVTGYGTSIFEYCDTEETYTGQGNISINPDFLPQNFLLNENSPCVDAGDPGTSFNDKEDVGNPGFALYPSLGALRNDIGAYGGSGAMLLPDTSGIVGVKEEGTSITPSSIILIQNYPNPFNPITRINYSIPDRSFVSLKVFDVLGNEVAKLVDEFTFAGEYQIEFESNGLTSGIYFYQLKAGSYIETKKMILMK
jgi:hypothetical protein